MTAPIYYSGSLTPSSPPHPPGISASFVITFADHADAKTFGDWMHRVIIGKVMAEGGQLMPLVGQPGAPLPSINGHPTILKG